MALHRDSDSVIAEGRAINDVPDLLQVGQERGFVTADEIMAAR